MGQRFSVNAQWIALAPLLGLLALAGGCGKTSQVTGKVLFQGRSVVYGSVILLGADNKARSGVIEPDGSYTVDGVGRGETKIAVISRDPSKGRSVRRDEHLADSGKASSPTPLSGWFPLPRRFEDPAASGLTCVVDSSRVNHDIEMK
jgi:hypothetical protein